MKSPKNLKYLFFSIVIIILGSCATSQNYVIKEFEITEENKVIKHIIVKDPIYYFIRKDNDFTFNILVDTNQFCDTRGKILIKEDSCQVNLFHADCWTYYRIYPYELVSLYKTCNRKTGAYELTEDGFNIYYSIDNMNFKFVFTQIFE